MDAQGTVGNAKADTVVYLDQGLGDIWVDHSQVGTDLTEDSAAYESPSARGAITGATGRELYVRFTAGSTDVNMIALIHADEGDVADHTYKIGLNGSGNVYFSQNDTTLATIVKPAGDRDLSIHWSTRPNPDTTGAGDAVISEFIVYDHTGSAYVDIVQVAHAISTTNAAWSLGVGGFYNGAAMTTNSGAPTQVRIGKAWHTSAEFAEDWVAARSAHGSTLPALLEPVPLTYDSGIADESEWTGQANVGYCAASADENRARCLTDLVNEVYVDARTLSTSPSPTQWLAGPPGGSTFYRCDVTRLRWLPHPGPKMAWVRVQVQSWVTTGSAVPIGIRCYAMNRPHLGVGPTLEGSPTPTLDYDFVQATLTANHGSGGAGVWLDLGLLRLPLFNGSSPSWVGTTTLVLAHAFDPAAASGNDANARLKIKAWHVRPAVGLG